MRLFDVAPSQVLSLQNFIEVIQDLVWMTRETGERSDLNRALFDCQFHSACSDPPPSQPAPPSPPPTQPRLPASQLFLHLRRKEASGIPLLGTMLAAFAQQWTKLRKESHVRVDMEFPVVINSQKRGQKLSCDGALCATLVKYGGNPAGPLPLALYEYKPTVDTRRLSVDPDHLMEVLLQGYHCLCQYNLKSVIHCLTDLYQWYYFLLCREGSKVRCKWYTSFYWDSPDEVDISAHVQFLHLATRTRECGTETDQD